MRSPSMRDALKPQDYLYTLATLGEQTEYRIIGAIKEVIVAPEDPQAVIALVAKPTTQLITTTITEKGYCLNSAKVDFEHPNLRGELASLENPKTIYGFLARGIIQRCQNENSQSKLTILCCDNISAGGELLKAGVEHLLQRHSAQGLAWSRENVCFASSMVDRVCPASDDDLRAMVYRDTERHDVWPVSAEPFTQWIIESKFAGERPALDQVGAVFVDDIAPFEQMKLRYLNASHSIIAALGYLSGDAFVHQSIARQELLNFTQEALKKNVLPIAAVPNDYDGATYIGDVIARFQNGNLPYANLQVGTDSSQKIQQRWFPTIDQAIAQSADCSYFEFCLGAWVIFVQTALENDDLNDPKRPMFEEVDTQDLDVMAKSYLKIANAEEFVFYRKNNFMNSVIQHASAIKANGISRALELFAPE